MNALGKKRELVSLSSRWRMILKMCEIIMCDLENKIIKAY